MHTGNLGLLFGDLGPGRVFSLKLRLVADDDEVFLDFLLDRQFEFALGVLQFALLAQYTGLGGLGLGQFCIVGRSGSAAAR